MRGLARMHLRARQRGAVLLILLALVSVIFIYAVVAGLNRSAVDIAQARAQKTSIALAQAKEALIAYAVTYAEDPSHSANLVPGFLPCPEMVATSGNEGVAAGAADCGSAFVSKLGRLPWRTLGLDALKDGSGECLWYAVSGTYKNIPNGVSGNTTTSNLMNWDTNGQFTVSDSNGNTLAGSAADNRAVAVIFAPGGPLSGQNRTPDANSRACGGNYTAAAYLETAGGINNSVVLGTANATNPFIAGTGSSTFNDQLVYITRADIWNAIKKRSDFNDNLRALTRRAAECTAMYGDHNGFGHDRLLPWASNVSLSTTSVPTYAVNASYNDATSTMAGRLAFKVNTARNDTNNDISSSISDYGTNSAYIFTNSSYCSYTPTEKIWYDNWKDQLFYAVAGNFRPTTSFNIGTCGTCLRLNSAGTTLAGNYAAVVIFAGEKLSGQSRNTATDKGSIANYLETSNAANIVADTGGGNYRVYASSGFNDIVYAIDTNLAVKCYRASSNTMVSVPAAPTLPPGPYASCP